VDETVFQAASATRLTSFVRGIVDLTRRRGLARLLDVVAGRSPSALVGWVTDRHPAWRAGIGIAALDPYRGYAVRHEALINRVGCKDPPPVCRSRPVKLGAA
jgi:hypothetical protein